MYLNTILRVYTSSPIHILEANIELLFHYIYLIALVTSYFAKGMLKQSQSRAFSKVIHFMNNVILKQF